QMLVVRRRTHAEGFEKILRAVDTAEALARLERIAAIHTHAPFALREGKKAEIAFGADGLQIFVPAFGTLDQEAGEPVMRFVLMQPDMGRIADARDATIGADEQLG